MSHGIKIEQPLFLSISSLVVDLILSWAFNVSFGDFSMPIVSFFLVFWLIGFIFDDVRLDKD